MSNEHGCSRSDLIEWKPRHPSFVGIDSDGCVFDTMELKQKQCFHPLIVSHWRLEPIEKEVREAAEFVNLYSKWRGQNRFPALLMTMDLLRRRPEVAASGVKLPDFTDLRRLVDSGVAVGNPALETAVQTSGSPELAHLLEWSKRVNVRVAETVTHVRPFRWVRESLDRIREHSDAIVISQTPAEALDREWADNDLTRYVEAIAGQELGTKAEHLALAARGKYPPDRVLMIGDAPGDYRAARANDALFYPIVPAQEEASWERFIREAYDRFLSGAYAGAYEAGLIAEFDAGLPESPPWASIH